ncbi:LppU/SCO3897 family protein [Streptomyces sp. 900116325]
MTTPPPPGQNPYRDPAAPLPARRWSVRRVLKGVVGVVVVGVVAYGGYTTWFGGAATADAGDCLHAGNAAATAVISVGDPEFEIVDCGTPEAQFKVSSRASGTDGTCDDQYQRYTQGGAGRDFTLCLEPLK